MKTELEYIATSKEILGALTNSKDNGSCIAINSPLFGSGFVVTGVEEIILGEDGEITIILKPYDMAGRFFE